MNTLVIAVGLMFVGSAVSAFLTQGTRTPLAIWALIIRSALLWRGPVLVARSKSVRSCLRTEPCERGVGCSYLADLGPSVLGGPLDYAVLPPDIGDSNDDNRPPGTNSRRQE